MKLILLALSILASSAYATTSYSESSTEKGLDAVTIFKVLSPLIDTKETCHYEYDTGSDFKVDESRIIQSLKQYENTEIILALCMPSMYNDHYVAFLVKDNNFTTAKEIRFSTPIYDAKRGAWHLESSRSIPTLIKSEREEQLVVLNLSSGRGTCGYIAHYDLQHLSTTDINNPTQIFANDDCELEIGPDEWPAISISPSSETY